MSEKENGGPAFPCQYQGDTRSDMSGITMRDYFAASAPITMDDAIKALKSVGADNFTGETIIEMLAYMRWQYADTMLEARKK